MIRNQGEHACLAGEPAVPETLEVVGLFAAASSKSKRVRSSANSD